MNRKEFLSLLKAVLPGVSKKESLEQGKCFVFTDKMLLAFNDTTAVMHPVDTEFRGAVAAEELYGIVKSLKDEEITMSQSDGKLLISTPDSRTELFIHSDIKLPIDSLPQATDWHQLPHKFDAALGVCVRNCPHESGNPLVNYILVEGCDMVVGDGVKVVAHKLDSPLPRFFIPGKVAKQVREHVPVAASMDNGWLLFKNIAGAIFCCRTVSSDEQFPFVVGGTTPLPGQYNVDSLLAFDGAEIRFPEKLVDAIEACRVMTKGSDGEEVVTLKCKDGVLLLTGKGAAGTHKKKLKVDGDLCFTAAMSPEALHDALHLGAKFTLGTNGMKVETEDYRVWLALMEE
jgi:hypothetical protein